MSTIPRLAAGLAAFLLLAGCSTFRPEYVDCPSIKLREGTERVVLLGADRGDLVSMRIRETAARCTRGRSGTEMRVGLALRLDRETGQPEFAERVRFDATFAFLDSGDQVVSRYVYSDDIHMQAFRLTTRPIVTIEFDVPEGTRVVFGIGRAEG